MPDENNAPSRPPPTREALAKYADTFNSSQMLRTLCASLSYPDPADRVVVRMDPILPVHRGGLGTRAVNGGVLAALFDFVIGTTPSLIDPTRRSATMQLSISFERPVKGDLLTAEGWIDREGSSVIFSSAVIKDQGEAICARCTGLVRLSKRPWPPDFLPRQ